MQMLGSGSEAAAAHRVILITVPAAAAAAADFKFVPCQIIPSPARSSWQSRSEWHCDWLVRPLFLCILLVCALLQSMRIS